MELSWFITMFPKFSVIDAPFSDTKSKGRRRRYSRVPPMETKHSKRALWPLGWSSYLDPELLLNDIPSHQFSWYKEWMLTQLLRHIKITKPHRMKQCQDGIDLVSVPFWRHPVGIDKPIFHRMGAQCGQVFFWFLMPNATLSIHCPSLLERCPIRILFFPYSNHQSSSTHGVYNVVCQFVSEVGL